MNTLKPARNAKRKTKRVGRGNASGKGTTAGRGSKGQRARAGGRNKLGRLGIRRLVMATPKLPGFKGRSAKSAVVNLNQVGAAFGSGETVSPKSLAAKGLIPSAAHTVKILGNGKLKKKLVFSGCKVSAAARERIVASGGEIR